MSLFMPFSICATYCTLSPYIMRFVSLLFLTLLSASPLLYGYEIVLFPTSTCSSFKFMPTGCLKSARLICPLLYRYIASPKCKAFARFFSFFLHSLYHKWPAMSCAARLFRLFSRHLPEKPEPSQDEDRPCRCANHCS